MSSLSVFIGSTTTSCCAMSSSCGQTRNSSTKDRHLQWQLLHQRGHICWPSHRSQPPGMHCSRSPSLVNLFGCQMGYIFTSGDFFICIVAQAVVSQVIFYRSTSGNYAHGVCNTSLVSLYKRKNEGWLSMALRLIVLINNHASQINRRPSRNK